MSLTDEVKKLRAEATAENQTEKIWEAIELIARGAESASSGTSSLRQDLIGELRRL